MFLMGLVPALFGTPTKIYHVRGKRIIFVIPFSMGVFYFLFIFSILFSVFSLYIISALSYRLFFLGGTLC